MQGVKHLGRSCLMTPRLLCPQCLQYTTFRPAHTSGHRYCGQCQTLIELSLAPYAVCFGFGRVPTPPDDRNILLLSNPDLEHRHTAIDVVALYIDTQSCSPMVLERCLTYLLNYPPPQGLSSLHVVCQGSLEALGEHLKNLLVNTFVQIQQVNQFSDVAEFQRTKKRMKWL